MGEGEGGRGEKGKEDLTQNHSANRVTHPKSGCGSDWITHNTPGRHRPQVNTSTAIAKEKSLKFFIDILIAYRQRRREEFKKALEGALKFFPGMKIKTRARIVFSKARS